MSAIALPPTEMKAECFAISEKKTDSWDFVDKAGKKIVGKKTTIKLYYDEDKETKTPTKCAFVLENVKTINGIQPGKKLNQGFMSINLTPDQSAMVTKYIDDVIFQIVWKHREVLFKGGSKLVHPMEIKNLFKGVVKQGDEQKDKDGNVVKGPDGLAKRWADSITCTVPMKKKQNQPVVDDTKCQVVDLRDRPYAWTALDRKELREVILEVDFITIGSPSNAFEFKVQTVAKSIVPNEEGNGGVKYTTKRRLEATSEEHTTTTTPSTPAAPANPADQAQKKSKTEKPEKTDK